jgi:hypothetical protein
MELRKSILIVCEGDSTEPSYFQKLSDIVYDRYRQINRLNDIFIKIDPVPQIQKDEEGFTLREGAKRRRTNSSQVRDDELVVEEKNKAQPLCYVRKAQILGLEDGAFSDVWAVYDRDEHPKHSAAVVLAAEKINGHNVQIGFTSVAFEHWILLHFVYDDSVFNKSMCRGKTKKKKKTYYFCGSNTHDQDCEGKNCVCGKIVSSGYLSYEGKRKEFKFESYHPNVETAIQNALRLRKLYLGSPTPFYERNPYTNIYRLVFKLLHLPVDYEWFDFSHELELIGLVFRFQIESTHIKIEVVNRSSRTKILPYETFRLIKFNGSSMSFGERMVIVAGEKIEVFSPPIINGAIDFDFIGLTNNETHSLITEIP